MGKETGKESKDEVSNTNVRTLMTNEGLGEASRELCTQFLYRISKEFEGKNAHLCLYSKIKYLNSQNNTKIRDSFFQYQFKKGFTFSIKHFHGAKGNYPVGFLIWNLSKIIHIKKQKIVLDVFNEDKVKYGTKQIYQEKLNKPITEWVERYKNERIMPPFKSAITMSDRTNDVRDKITNDFLCSLSSKGNDFQNQNSVFILSTPYHSAGAYSVTPNNFEKSMILHTIRRMPKATWTNDRDIFYTPDIDKLSEEFINDCIIWSAFADSNNTTSIKDVEYKDNVYQIRNNLYPFQLKEVKTWECSSSEIGLQLASANEDRFLATYLKSKKLSPEAQNVLKTGKELYKYFYKELCNTRWMDYKIAYWDVGLWQVKQALKSVDLGNYKLEALKQANKELSEKLLPKIYEYGFLVEDVKEYEKV